MGLDVYVGPLARYYSFEWETVVQRAGREQGLEVRIMRQPGFVKPDPEDALQRVATWRKALGDTIGVPMRWDESAFGDYETDRRRPAMATASGSRSSSAPNRPARASACNWSTRD